MEEESENNYFDEMGHQKRDALSFMRKSNLLSKEVEKRPT